MKAAQGNLPRGLEMLEALQLPCLYTVSPEGLEEGGTEPWQAPSPFQRKATCPLLPGHGQDRRGLFWGTPRIQMWQTSE
jgi:hypothetical protein